MDKYDNMKIKIKDIYNGQSGISITFNILCNKKNERNFFIYLNHDKIKTKTHFEILDMAWDDVVNDVNGWLETLSVCKELSKLKNTIYKPKL